MNIKAQCCGIVVMIVLFLFYKFQKKIHLHTGQAFKNVFAVTFVSILLDMLSLVAISNLDYLPMWIIRMVCKTYVASLVLVALYSLLYIYSDLYPDSVRFRKITLVYRVIAGVGIVLIYSLPIYIHIGRTSMDVYTHGPSVLTTYAFAVALVVINIYTIVKERDKINPRRREAVLFWMGIWFLAAVIQFLNNSLLVVGFASAIGMMILYLKLENPETNLDRETNLFNQTAFLEYLHEISDGDNKCAVLCLYFERLFHRDMHDDIEQRVVQEVYSFLVNLPGTMLFKSEADEITIIFKDFFMTERLVDKIRKRFESGWGREHSVMLRPHGIYIADMESLDDICDIPYLFRYIRSESRRYIDNYFVRVNDKMIKEMYQERAAEQMILKAIEEDRIEVFYQPIYSTKEKNFISAEALVRMRDARGNLIPPSDFIGAAEKNGMIVRLGEIVFEKVCCFIRDKKPEEYGIKYIEVNLSVVQCAYPKLAIDLMKIMDEYGIDPSFINLEITESASLAEKRNLMDNMAWLMKKGMKFSLDDFGTGQSNLNYIVDMPVHIVKFDKDMTSAYFKNGKAKYVMDAAIQMIHGLGMEIVSEGIETKEQYDTMEQLGIDFVQGYYFSKPVTAGEFLFFLRENRSKR